jgi:hypothetical protein
MNLPRQKLDPITIPLYDGRQNPPPKDCKIKHPPIMYMYKDMKKYLSFDFPIICIADWQFTDTTQKYFIDSQLSLHLKDYVKDLSKAIFIIAGDMISKDNTIYGVKSDAVPNYELFQDLVEDGHMFCVYGNHDNMTSDHKKLKCNGAKCILPHGFTVNVPQPYNFTISGVHGIPCSKKNLTNYMKEERKKYRNDVSEYKKIERRRYRKALENPKNTDILVTHLNPKLPEHEGNTRLEDDVGDHQHLFDTFMKSSARLLVHGHFQISGPVTIINDSKVVVNTDHRVVVLLP